MGRVARNQILYGGCYAHVFSRASERRRIFKNDKDFQEFKKILFAAKNSYGFKIYHYCIMQTHFHMVVSIGKIDAFSMSLQVIKKKYAYYYNSAHKRFGPLWRDRFKSLLIENEKYLYACGLYVENNPVKAGLVKEAESWMYSSAFIKGKNDLLVDSYSTSGLPDMIDIGDDEFFTKGIGIGSSLFKLYLREEIA